MSDIRTGQPLPLAYGEALELPHSRPRVPGWLHALGLLLGSAVFWVPVTVILLATLGKAPQ